MNLPKPKKIKLIDKKKFAKLAKKVKESFDEELRYLYEKKMKNGHNLSSHSNSIP